MNVDFKAFTHGDDGKMMMPAIQFNPNAATTDGGGSKKRT